MNAITQLVLETRMKEIGYHRATNPRGHYTWIDEGDETFVFRKRTSKTSWDYAFLYIETRYKDDDPFRFACEGYEYRVGLHRRYGWSSERDAKFAEMVNGWLQ